MPPTLIAIEQHASVRVLRLNRPDALNAFTAAMLDELRYSLERAAEDASVCCVVLAAAGRAFSVGQDLADPLVAPGGDAPKDLGRMLEQHYVPLVLCLRAMPVPVVAAVQGVAAGAGANLAIGCDLVIAAEGAIFLQAFSRIGLVPDCGGTWLLPRLVGRAKALELALLGDKLPAPEAQRLGLIARVVPDAELPDAALALAQRLAALPTRALAQTRRAMDEAMGLDLEPALRREVALQRQLGFAHDYLEGTAAFLGRRAPTFTDR
ncbi:enoyl-CoA hydratase-related protein [Roseateles cellulosilyticus]|uniref:Enoyl-CoA hydratase-related protein n=1 Tax=Pelomonas cellulosilytica TaxID=2906762 RepID=A0ABS8XU95_9BURK|nr:enoyl-CoA hydratase-related protein [Pelomonas sp. P8]MCE4554457.1 enoyl-CoA hydratase-related protein [Pelomonas sp. P8]